MATDDDPLTVDDLVTGRAAAELGEGVLPTGAILLVETVSENGQGFRFVMNEGMATWKALGMLRSATLCVEGWDIDGWGDD